MKNQRRHTLRVGKQSSIEQHQILRDSRSHGSLVKVSPKQAVLSKRVRLKILAMGPSNAGKSTLIKRFCGEIFHSQYNPTIGVDFGTKPLQINGIDIRIDFFDLSGDAAYFDIRNEFYGEEIDGILLVYDASDRNSFDSIIHSLHEFKQGLEKCSNAKYMPGVLCANKTDKAQKVQESEGLSLAASHNMKYFEVSSKTGRNVEAMFMNLFKKLLARAPVR